MDLSAHFTATAYPLSGHPVPDAKTETVSIPKPEGDMPALSIALVSDATVLSDILAAQGPAAAEGAGAGLFDLSFSARSDGIAPLLQPGIDAVIFDLGAATATDLEALQRVVAIGPDVPIVALLTEAAEPGVMLSALRTGAEDCVIFDAAEIGSLAWTVRRAVERARNRAVMRPSGPAATGLWGADAPDEAAGHGLTLVQETPDAMIILDREGRVKFANPQAAELLGTPVDMLIGRPFDLAVHTADEGEIRLMLPNGETRYAEMQLVDSEWDGVPARIATLNDVTVRRKLEKAIKAAYHARTETTHRSRSFFSNVNHDLRTPLTHIIGFSELMKDEQFGPLGQPRYQEYARDIHSSGRILLDMIEDLLNIAEAETDEVRLTDEICHLRQLLEITLASQRTRAAQAGIRIELDCPDELPGLRGDARRLRQGLFRLIAEALHCLAKGSLLRIEVAERADGLAIRVRGEHSLAGIPAGQGDLLSGEAMGRDGLSSTEHPFISAEQSGRARENGLSLTLVRKVMELHGGTLSSKQFGPGRLTIELKFPADRLVR